VSVNGGAYSDFNQDSVAIFNTPAEVICRTAEAT